MPYSSQHKQLSREKILAAAVDLFCRHGFDQVSITQVMKQACMTHGAFYAHFKSKSELYGKAINHAAVHSLWVAEKSSATSIEKFMQLISSYLSLNHVNQIDAPCPLAFLVTDAAHRDKQVRISYQNTFQNMIVSMSAQLDIIGIKPAKPLALQIMTSLIGCVSIARTLTDKQWQEQLLETNKDKLFQLLLDNAS